MDTGVILLTMMFCLHTGVLFVTFLRYGAFLPRRIPHLAKCLALIVVCAASGALSYFSLLLPEGRVLEALVICNVVLGYLLNVLLVQIVLCLMGYNRRRDLFLQRFLYLIPALGVVFALLQPLAGLVVGTVTKEADGFGYLIEMHPFGMGLAVLSSSIIAVMFLLAIFAFARVRSRFIHRRIIVTISLSVLLPSALKYVEMFIELGTGVNYRLSTFTSWLPVLVICYVYFGFLRSARIKAVDHSDEAYVVFDKWGNMVDINQAGRSLLGMQGRAALPGRAAFAAMLGLKTLGNGEAEFKLEREGQARYYQLRAFQVSDGLSQYCGDGYNIREVTEFHEQMAALNTLATEDALTGALNRRAFFEAAPTVLRRAARTDAYVTLLMIDIDHFKRINDSRGHGVGDEVLRQMSVVCEGNLRRNDSFFRYGGEEFVVLCKDTGPEEGALMAERLCRAVEATVFETSAGPLHVTISVGGCAFKPARGEAVEPWVDKADVSMYKAKQAGRNRAFFEAA